MISALKRDRLHVLSCSKYIMDWHEKNSETKTTPRFLVCRARGIDLVAEKSWALPFESVGFSRFTLINTRGIPQGSHGYFLQAILVGFLAGIAYSRYPWGAWAALGYFYWKYPRVWILAFVYPPVGLGWHCRGIEFHPCQNSGENVIPITIPVRSLLIGQIPVTKGMIFINARSTLVQTTAINRLQWRATQEA